MPFPVIGPIPKGTPVETLLALRGNVVTALAEAMQCPKHAVVPILITDPLDPPVSENDGGQCLYVRVDTGMVHGVEGPERDEMEKVVTAAVAHAVWHTFGGSIEVECFTGDLNPKTKTLLHSASGQ